MSDQIGTSEISETPVPQKSAKARILNQVDSEFMRLMDFIKGCNVQQMKEAILRNLRYYQDSDPSNYQLTVDYYNKYKLWGEISLDKEIYDLIDDRAQTLVEHREDFEWLYSRLGDFRSKRVLVNILAYWLTFNFRKIAQIQDKYFHQYFDFDLIDCTPEEVFVDMGAYIGDTAVDYYNTFGADGYKRIYCYEIVPSNVEFVRKNVELFHMKNVEVRFKGASDKNGVLYLKDNPTTSTSYLKEEGEIEIPTVAIDDDIDEPVSFIKMDIEGGEEQALMGCRGKIRESHPKLALSVYHNHKDLWKLARIIDETDPTYRFYLRYHGEVLLPTEYLLYAL